MSADESVRFAVITVSDRCSSGVNQDKSGLVLKELIEQSKLFRGSVVKYEVIPDEYQMIKHLLSNLADSNSCDMIITSGGTGFTPRDVTPDATRAILDREAPAMVHALTQRSLEATPMAALSRLTCGKRKSTWIVNFPGSSKAAKECFEVIEPIVLHAKHLICQDDQHNVEKLHAAMQMTREKYHSAGSGGQIESGTAVQQGIPHQKLTAAMELTREKFHPSGDKNQSDNSSKHHKLHAAMEMTREKFAQFSHAPIVSKVRTDQIANRDRHSTYKMWSVEDAVNRVITEVGCVQRQTEKRNYMDVAGFVCSEDIVSGEDHPPFPASIKDGYAVKSTDGNGKRQVLGSVTAGSAAIGMKVESGFCVRVSTGAPIPDGADAVVQVEDTALIGQLNGNELEIEIQKTPKVGQDIRPIGSDVARGTVLCRKHEACGPAEIGLLVSMGITSWSVFCMPIVGVMSTGNEVSEPDVEYLERGKIRDSNRTLIRLLLQKAGFDTLDCGIVKDEPNEMLNRISACLEHCDILVTSGGVSMGEKDILKEVLVHDLNFEVIFGRVFMKPGKPTAFCKGQYNGREKFVFGLPGNPVSCWVTCHLYVLPAVRHYGGALHPTSPVISVEVDHEVQLDPRPEYHRAMLTNRFSSAGFPIAVSCSPNQMSSRLLSVTSASVLLMLPAKSDDQVCVKPGTVLKALVL